MKHNHAFILPLSVPYSPFEEYGVPHGPRVLYLVPATRAVMAMLQAYAPPIRPDPPEDAR